VPDLEQLILQEEIISQSNQFIQFITRPVKLTGKLGPWTQSDHNRPLFHHFSRATNYDLSEQLQRLRDEINGLSPQLVEEVPSEIEDVDTAFDDESKRWFARELYSLKLECEKGMSKSWTHVPPVGLGLVRDRPVLIRESLVQIQFKVWIRNLIQTALINP